MQKVEILPEIIEYTDTDTDTELEPLYRVIIHNDPVTPMDFVVSTLTSIFYLGVDRATEVMLKAHINSTAYVQTLPETEADKRISKAHLVASTQGYPLHFSKELE